MTVIVRVAGWLAGSFLVSMFTKRNNSSILFRKRPKFLQHYCSCPPTPPPPQLSPPTIWFLPFNIPIRVQREGCVCQMRNYMQRGGGSSVVGERGGRLRKGGFPSVVRTPSVPHFQLPIFLSSRNFRVFLHFLLLFVYAKELRNFIIVVPWPFEHMPIFRITNLINFGTFISTNQIFLNINYFPSQYFFGFERNN
jgi:hypothetical protein